ncbi:MAG: 6-bladed beta-propeller [Mangrovibacterium sp.]
MKNICIVLILFLLTSCIGQKKEKKKSINSKPIVELNISNELFDENKDYSSLVGSIEVIKLETNVNSLIGDIRKIEFQNNKFYILDDSQVLYLFNEIGNYLNKLDKRGKGPGEYLEMRDFFVDKDGSIKVLSYNTILKYDSTLKFLEKKTISIHPKFKITLNFLTQK